MTILYHGEQCGVSSETDHRTMCEHLLWCPCAEQGLLTCACTALVYTPSTSLHAIQEDRKREKEREAA